MKKPSLKKLILLLGDTTFSILGIFIPRLKTDFFLSLVYMSVAEGLKIKLQHSHYISYKIKEDLGHVSAEIKTVVRAENLSDLFFFIDNRAQ